MPRSLRQAWNLHVGDYLPIDPERRRIGRAEIAADEELSDPAVSTALHKLRAKGEEDLYSVEPSGSMPNTTSSSEVWLA